MTQLHKFGNLTGKYKYLEMQFIQSVNGSGSKTAQNR